MGLPIGTQLATVRSNGGFVGLDVRCSFPLSDAFQGTDIENRIWQLRLRLGRCFGS